MVMTVRAIEHQPIRRLKRAEWDEMVKAGVFHEDERIELVFGQVVEMSPIGRPHVEAVYRLHRLLLLALGDRAKAYCQASFAATDDSEPQPDIYVTPPDNEWSRLPERAYLVVEVADGSLRYDRGEKALLYSISQVDEYWVVDLDNGLVEVRRDRNDGEWRSLQTFRRGDTIAMQTFPDVTIAAAEILPPA